MIEIRDLRKSFKNEDVLKELEFHHTTSNTLCFG